MAVASDCNPGSAPGASLLLALNMASRLFGLTSEEVLAGATRHAAQALGEQAVRGSLAPGFAADFAIWNIASHRGARLLDRLQPLPGGGQGLAGALPASNSRAKTH